MRPYLSLLQETYESGTDHIDRTGVGRRSIFGTQRRFDLQKGFPLVTTREINTDVLIRELLWFIQGDTNVETLGSKIWNNWAVKQSNIDEFIEKHAKADSKIFIEKYIEQMNALNHIGPMYGHAWRYAPVSNVNLLNPEVNISKLFKNKLKRYESEYEQYLNDQTDENKLSFENFVFINYYAHIDQLENLVTNLKERPYSARHCVTAWIPEWVPFEDLTPEENVLLGKGCLAPCHAFFQCFVEPPISEGRKPRLSLQLYIRSNDLPIGAPYNIAQYSILTHMLAQSVNMEVGHFVWTVGDCHIYRNQMEQYNHELIAGVETQLQRHPYQLPNLKLNPDITELDAFQFNDIVIENYQHHDKINYPLAK